MLLNESLPKHLYALDFTLEHYNNLLKRLSVDTNEELFNDKRGAINKALIHYFTQTDQNIDLHTSFKSFTIKKHFTGHSRSEAYDRMLHHNASLLVDILSRKEEFHLLPYLVSIPSDIRIQLIQKFIDSKEPIEVARSIIRQQIEKVFTLDTRDIIIFLRGKISIRYYTPPKKIPAGMDKRFAGETVESMESMYLNYFPEGAWENIEEIIDEVLADKLNFAFIDNMTFTKTFIPVFRSMIEIILLDVVSEEDHEKIEGQAGYILRQYFHKILLHTARNLLNFVENRDKNAEIFIKYFSDDVVIDDDGNKIQKHAIVDKRQQRWNYSSIVSVMMQYKQAKIRISTQKESIVVAQERVDECQNEINAEHENKNKLIEESEKIELLLADNDTRTIQLKRKSTANTEEMGSIKRELRTLSDQYTELLKKKKNMAVQLEFIKNRLTNKTTELSQRNKKLKYEKKNFETVLEQTASIKEIYELLVEAVSLVLAKR